MSNTKWTQGPWQRSGWSVLCQSHTVVCNILPWDSSGCREEDSANAHLIAAAPELYEALRVSVEVLEKTANDTLIGRNAAESGRTVLAKARGEVQESEK
jgi:hypothetical protein